MNFKPASDSPLPRLITTGANHYCEKARWALDWLQIPYVEESLFPPFHRSIIAWHGGDSVPVLVTTTDTFTDSRDILHYADAIASNNRRLYPHNPQLRRHVNNLEAWFDTQLGISTCCWLYAQVIAHRRPVKRLWLQQTSGLEKLAFESTYLDLHQQVRKVYSATPKGAVKSLQKIRQIFGEVEDWLTPGQDYLVGDCFTAADLTFASLAAPVLFPPEYGFQLPVMEQLPDEMATIIQSFRETSAGAYALRIYREHRCRRPKAKNLSLPLAFSTDSALLIQAPSPLLT